MITWGTQKNASKLSTHHESEEVKVHARHIQKYACTWVVLYIRVPFRAPVYQRVPCHFGDQTRDPDLENCPDTRKSFHADLHLVFSMTFLQTRSAQRNTEMRIRAKGLGAKSRG